MVDHGPIAKNVENYVTMHFAVSRRSIRCHFLLMVTKPAQHQSYIDDIQSILSISLTVCEIITYEHANVSIRIF